MSIFRRKKKKDYVGIYVRCPIKLKYDLDQLLAKEHISLKDFMISAVKTEMDRDIYDAKYAKWITDNALRRAELQ